MEKATATSAMEKALSLPELLTCIGRYLGRDSTIVACLCVCKQWKLQFEPLLWRHFHVASPDDYDTVQPSTELMEQNAAFIRSLTVHKIAPADHEAFYSNCTQLEDLKIIVDPIYLDLPERWTFLANIIRKLPRLRKININNPGAELPHDLFKAIADCSNIIVLETQGYSLKAEDMEVYFRASATHMKRLSSTQDHFDHIPKLPDGIMFQEVRYLDIKDASGLSVEAQLDWIRRCPNLISLRWEAMRNLSASQFCQIIPAACPHLTSLHLFTDISDEEIALILEAIPRVEKLNMSWADFGDKSMAALRRHFPWLKDLNLQYCDDFSSQFIHEALCSCPNLQSISGHVLDYEDIAASPKPWICKGLQMFDVGLTIVKEAQEEEMKDIDLGPGTKAQGLKIAKRSMNEKLFQRLGQLTELQYLSIGTADDDGVDSIDLPILDVHIALEFLTGLKHIKYFSCKGLFDELVPIKVEDAARWMVKHWPQLETLEARFILDTAHDHYGPGRQKAQELLQKHGIVVEEYDGREYDEDYEFDEFDHDEDEYDEYYGDDADGFTDMEDDSEYDYDYDEDEDGLEDLAYLMQDHTLD